MTIILTVGINYQIRWVLISRLIALFITSMLTCCLWRVFMVVLQQSLGTVPQSSPNPSEANNCDHRCFYIYKLVTFQPNKLVTKFSQNT